MKIAIVHDWLTGLRGGERCLEEFLRMYPQADIFTLIHVPGATSAMIDDHVHRVSWLNQIPFSGRWYRAFLPLFPAAISRFDFSGYDLVISLSHAAAKNIEVPRGVRHLSYCFTPMRYIWDQAPAYFGRSGTMSLWPVLRALRIWDQRGSARVTAFASISRFVAARIRRFYGRSSQVIHPPVNTTWIPHRRNDHHIGEAFLYAGALVPYKRPDVIVEAFRGLPYDLWIAGGGPMEEELRGHASKNVHFLGRLSDEALAQVYGRCRALIFPVKEDFGMIPIECLAAGRPVISSYEGATRESLGGAKIWEAPSESSCAASTGIAFRWQPGDAVRSLREAVEFFVSRELLFQADVCYARAARFSPEVFRRNWSAFVDSQGTSLC